MLQYTLRRLLAIIPTLFGMALLIFVMVRMLPGDFVDAMVGADSTLSAEAREQLRASYGLSDSIPQQFVRWMGGLFTGDLGVSFRTGEPIIKILAAGLPVTLELAVLSSLVATSIAIPLGIVSATNRNGIVDFWARVAGLIGLSFPNFWLATVMLLATSLWFQWVPPVIWISPFTDLKGNLLQILLPVLALSVQLIAIQMRMVRTSMLEVLRQDYIRTARAKGLAERVVVYGHALRNAFIPVVTVIGLQLGALMGGSVIIEQIFGLPGLGWFLLQAIYNRDYPVIQVTALFLASVFVLINLVVDLLYAWLDPRIKYR
jgi:peptide/nickel transport system permease protein